MTVLWLVPQMSDSDTVAALRALLRRASVGKVIGLAVCYRERGGREDTVFTGPYFDRPAEAVKAAMKMSWQMTQTEEVRRGSP